MKNHSKVGKLPGRPTYRTPSRFIAGKTINNTRIRKMIKLSTNSRRHE